MSLSLLLRVAFSGAIVFALSVPVSAPAHGADAARGESVAVEATAPASPPTDADVDRFVDWMGLGDAIPAILRTELAKVPEMRSLSAQQQECMIDVLRPPMRSMLRSSFRELLGEREIFLAWAEFVETDAGRKLFAFVRAGVEAKIKDQTAPDPAAFFADIGEREQMQMAQFMMTPAAAVMNKPFPDMQPPAEMLEEFEQEARTRCGIDFPKG